jgi:hypothetical protein
MTLAEAILDAAKRLRLSLRMDRNAEPFFLEQDEAIHDLEVLARRFEGQISDVTHETISERRA